jgi:HEPN domain-containing protein
MQLQGQALEIALKVCLKNRGVQIPQHHDLVRLAAACTELVLSEAEQKTLARLNEHYYRGGGLNYHARYRSDKTQVFVHPSQDQVEAVYHRITSNYDPG